MIANQSSTAVSHTVGSDVTGQVALREYLASSTPIARLGHACRITCKGVFISARRRGAAAAKRLIDVIGAACGIACLSPLFLLVAILIKATDNGPVLFWQTRVGRRGKTFPFPKFRSMVTNAEKLKETLLSENDHGQSVTFKMKRDPRVTWIGRIIRRLSIDELPQLWCVLVGHMSLVGPRPPVPKEVDMYSLQDRRRLESIPGLTCTWQVSGRGDIPFEEQVKLDVDYIRNASLWSDIKLILQTIPAVVTGKGAY